MGRKPLLEPVSTVVVPAVQEFIVREHFAPDKGKWIFHRFGPNFEKSFLGKVEGPTDENTLRYYNLRRQATGRGIVSALGGQRKAEVTLGQVFSLIKAQEESSSGSLILNGFMNIFPIRDVDGILRSVGCERYISGWFFLATSLKYDGGWLWGNRVFSPS